MAIGRRVRDTETDPFYDMLFNMLIAFVFCLVLALVAFNPQARKAGDVPAKAEMMITVSWPDGNPNDVDTWITEPGGKTLWLWTVRPSPAPHAKKSPPCAAWYQANTWSTPITTTAATSSRWT